MKAVTYFAELAELVAVYAVFGVWLRRTWMQKARERERSNLRLRPTKLALGGALFSVSGPFDDPNHSTRLIVTVAEGEPSTYRDERGRWCLDVAVTLARADVRLFEEALRLHTDSGL